MSDNPFVGKWSYRSLLNDPNLAICASRKPKRLSGPELYFFHNSLAPMPISLTTLLAALCSIFRSRAALEIENLALRHQIGVLQRSARKRPRLTSGDRLLWVCVSLLWRDWRSTLVIVKPETVVAWHRKGFRLFWTWKVRHGQPDDPSFPARPKTRSDPQDVPGEPRLGCTPHPRRTAQTRHRDRRE
jgi:hypothetical protein